MQNKIYIPANPFELSETGPAEIDALFEQLAETDIKQFVLYIHGGLNGRSYAEERADRLSATWKADGRHVISLIWETDPQNTIVSLLHRKISLPIIQKTVDPLRRWVENWRGGDAGAHQEAGSDEMVSPSAALSDAELASAEMELSDYLDDVFKSDDFIDRQLIEGMEETFQTSSYRQELDKIGRSDLKRDTKDQPEGSSSLGGEKEGFFLDMIESFSKRKFISAGLMVLKRRASGRGHGLRETIIEELVREFSFSAIKTFWEDMKTRAREMWRGESDNVMQPAAHFMHKLIAWKQADPTRTIELVGHSAGSIAICYLLAEADWQYPDLKNYGPLFRDVIFLAPAATSDLFYEEVVSKPERYDRFRMFTMSDELERRDTIKVEETVVYRKSLLYFVAGILEHEPDQPLSGMMRYLNGEVPFDEHKLLRIGRYLQAGRGHRLIESVTRNGDLDKQSAAVTHGAFDDDAHTMKSIKIMLGQELGNE